MDSGTSEREAYDRGNGAHDLTHNTEKKTVVLNRTIQIAPLT